MPGRRAADGGFTVAELSVVLALLGVMLSVTYAGMRVVYQGRDASDRQAWFAREIGSPLEQLDQLLSQNTQISSATSQTATFLIDRPRRVGSTTQFDNMEQHAIAPQLNPRTGRFELIDTVRGTDELWNPTTVVRDVSWSDDIANGSTGVPLFAFKDANGDDVSPANAEAQAKQVVITIVSRREGRLYRGSRTVYLRNK